MTAFINETIFQQGSLKPLRKPSDIAIKKIAFTNLTATSVLIMR